jgi:arylsulfatase A-like enzyme
MFVDVRIGQDRDPRPVGSADDIVALAERSDTNVLFILIDTLRADRLGSYGYERATSPEFDRLAAGGALFRRHLSQSSWTKCSMASLWLAMNPTSTGVTRFDDILPDEARLPAEILKDAGFRTVGIYRNGWVAPTFGFDQGFDTYMRPAPRPLPPSVRLENPTISKAGTDQDGVASALEFLRVYGDERWFLYLHMMDVHEYVYDEESALFGGAYGDVYDNSILWTDGVLGVFLDHLAAEGYLENTLIVVTSDHGEAFRERGLEGHARRVYRETTEVPLAISFPFRLEPGLQVEARSRNIDVWPTILDLIGLEPSTNSAGRSLVPDLLASARGLEPPVEDRTGYAHLDQHWGQRNRPPTPTVAVSDGPLRYVRTEELGRKTEQLFDASLDPAELIDRSEDDPENLERLRRLADAYLATEPPWGSVPKREIGELELNQLRALGYAIP